MGLNPILALQTALGVLTAVFVAGWSAAVVAVRRAPRAADLSCNRCRRTNRHPGGHRRTLEFLRYARDRVVRNHHGALARAPGHSRSVHPRHAERRSHAADGRAGVHLHDHRAGGCADALRVDCGRGPRRMARCRCGRVVAEAEGAGRDGRGAARRRRAHVHDADEHVSGRRRRARRPRREAR